jgi:hypothetical protein
MTKWGATPRWKVLEDWILGTGTMRFTAMQLAGSLRIPMSEASLLINSHLHSQRGRRSESLYLIKREGRTRNAAWTVGERTADVRILNDTLLGDIRVKVLRAWGPDMKRLAEINPRAARRVEMTLKSVIDGALVVLAGALTDTSDE